MADLDARIRSDIDYAVQTIKGADPDGFVEIAADELRDALLAVLDLHRPKGAVPKADGGTGGEACSATECTTVRGFFAYAYPCPTVRAIGERLGVGVAVEHGRP